MGVYVSRPFRDLSFRVRFMFRARNQLTTHTSRGYMGKMAARATTAAISAAAPVALHTGG